MGGIAASCTDTSERQILTLLIVREKKWPQGATSPSPFSTFPHAVKSKGNSATLNLFVFSECH